MPHPTHFCERCCKRERHNHTIKKPRRQGHGEQAYLAQPTPVCSTNKNFRVSIGVQKGPRQRGPFCTPIDNLRRSGGLIMHKGLSPFSTSVATVWAAHPPALLRDLRRPTQPVMGSGTGKEITMHTVNRDFLKTKTNAKLHALFFETTCAERLNFGGPPVEDSTFSASLFIGFRRVSP